MKESSRQERIIRTSLIGILVNLLIAAVKNCDRNAGIVNSNRVGRNQ